MPRCKPIHCSGVYLICCCSSSKVYVGSSTRSVYRRLRGHKKDLQVKSHKNKHLQSAWNKYGESAFTFELLEECPAEECLKLEQFWIDAFRSANRKYGYNVCPTAGNSLGAKLPPCSLEKKASTSKNSLQWWASLSPEERDRRADRMSEVWQDPEYKEKLGLAIKEAFNRPEVKAKHSESLKKAWARRGYKKKMIAILTARYKDPELRKEISKCVKAAMTPEVRAKISAAGLRRWAREGAKEKHPLTMKRALSSPEIRYRMGSGMRDKNRSEVLEAARIRRESNK